MNTLSTELRATAARVVALAPSIHEASDAADVQALEAALKAVTNVLRIGDGQARATALLSDPPFAAALLRCTAFGARWLSHDDAVDVAEARRGVGLAALGLTALLVDRLPQLPAAGPLPFLRTLLRMQTLQCMARAIAVSTDRALPCGGAVGAAAVGGAAEEDGVAGRLSFLLALTTVVSRTLELLTALTTIDASVAAQPPPQQAPAAAAAADKERRRLQVLQRVFVGELVSALADSGVMEHLARALLVMAELAGEPGADESLSMATATCHERFGDIRYTVRELVEAAPPLGGAATAARLHAALQHPYVLHLEVTSGLALLCLADGGPSHGLPQALLQGLPVLAEGPDGEAVDARILSGRQCVPLSAVVDLNNGISRLACQPHNAPALRPAAAASLLLRLGRWAVASGRAWAELQPEPHGEEAAGPQPEPHGEEAAGPQAAIAKAGEPAEPLPLQLLLQPDELGVLLESTLLQLYCILTKPGIDTSHGWAWRAAAERWVLVAAACRHVLPIATGTQVDCLAKMWSGLTAGEERRPSGAFPPEPPAQVAAALAAGLLPCLERLLRRGAEQPSGNEGHLAAKLLQPHVHLVDNVPGSPPTSHVMLARLLTYGEPAQAAALVTTIAKLLWRWQDVEDLKADPVCTAVFTAVSKLYGHCRRFTGPEPSAAHPQLRLMLLRSAVEWLPPMARHAQQASAEVKEYSGARAMEDASVWANLLLLHVEFLSMWTSILLEGPSQTEAAAADGDPSGDGGWRRFVLEELQVLPLFGSLLRNMDAWVIHPGTAPDTALYTKVWHGTVRMCAAVASAVPDDVRQAAQAGAAAEAAAAAQTRAAGGRGPRRGRGSAKRVPEGGSSAGYWPPETLESLAGKMGTGFAAGRVLARAVASLLRRWAAGEDAAFEIMAVRMGLSDRDEWLHRWGPLPPLASVRALLPSCAHPRCTRLDGDSEAGRELRRYPGCGEGAYCSAACAQEHGAGAAAGGVGAGPGGAGPA